MFRPNTKLVILLISLSAFAQSERGTITGTVHDKSGAVIPAATVRVTDLATNVAIVTTTNDVGEYTIPNLSPGRYNIRFEKDGFRPAQEDGLELLAATTSRADASLDVGSSTQVAEVQASAVQLQTEDAKSSSTVQNALVTGLPLVIDAGGTGVRSAFNLAALTPEAKNLGGINGFSFGGGQAASYGTSLDGISANTSRALTTTWISSNTPSVEAIDQFTVDTNGYKAEFSHAAGGNMSFVSKSGTSQYHGAVYWYLRNNDFDANNFFNNRSGIPISVYKQNDFGATFGGPIRIPKIYDGRNKSFFFFSYEGFRNRAGANGTVFTIPTPEMYNGDFSNWVTSAGKVIPIFDPTTQTTLPNGTTVRSVYPGNKIPASEFNPVAIQAIQVFQGSSGHPLAPNNGAAPGTAAYVNNNYLVTAGTQVFPINKWSLKGDHNFSDRNRISLYYGHDREQQTGGPDGPPTLPGLYTNYNTLIQSSDVGRASWDWTFSPTKLNHFYMGINDWRQDHKPPQELTGGWKSKFCLVNVPNCDDNLVQLFYNTGGSDPYSNWGGQADNGSENPAWGWGDDFTLVKGKHTLKMGGLIQYNHYNGFGRQCEAGCVGLSYQETGVPGGSNPNAGGNAFASMLLGYADSGQIDTLRYIGQHFRYFGGYIQDDWRVNQKLVVNLGLRWDGNLPPQGQNSEWSNFSPATANPAAGGIPGAVVFAGNGPGRLGYQSLSDFWHNGWGPRIGFAYSYDSKTVIRGAYGRSYGSLVSVSGSTHNMGFTLTQTFSSSNSGITPTYTLDQGMPPWTAPPFINPSVSNGTSVSWFQGNETTKLPAFDNVSFSIQRQIGSSLQAEIGYNGVNGTHLQSQLLQYNQINPSYLTAFGSVAQSVKVLNSLVGSPLANQYGIVAPFAGFNTLWGSRATVAQALRPFPQYSYIDTYAGQGDHSGHSTYNALILKLTKRYTNGLTLLTSYVFSKILTDSDSAWGSGYAADFFNRGLEKSIGAFDVTHDFKFSALYELPFGKGKPFLTSGPASWILGNWRLAGSAIYDSGTPIGVGTSLSLPIYPSGQAGRVPAYVSSYNGWQPHWSGGFDPSVDNFFVPYGSGPFPLQGSGTALNSIGNETRLNPKLRLFPNLNENISLARTFPIKEFVKLEFRAEAFNVFNRVRFGTGSTTLQSSTFGVLTGSGSQINTPRQLQLALRLIF